MGVISTLSLLSTGFQTTCAAQPSGQAGQTARLPVDRDSGKLAAVGQTA